MNHGQKLQNCAGSDATQVFAYEIYFFFKVIYIFHTPRVIGHRKPLILRAARRVSWFWKAERDFSIFA